MRNARLISWLLGASLALGSPLPVLAAGQFEDLPPGDRLSLVLLALVIGGVVAVGLLALELLYSVLQAPAVRRGSDRLRQRPAYLLGLGVLAFLALGGALALVQWLPKPAKDLVGLAVLLAGGYLLVAGATMVSHAIGEQIHANLNSRYVGSSFMAVLTGGALTLLIGGVPVLGQLVQVVILLVGLGAATASLTRGPPVPANPPPAA